MTITPSRRDRSQFYPFGADQAKSQNQLQTSSHTRERDYPFLFHYLFRFLLFLFAGFAPGLATWGYCSILPLFTSRSLCGHDYRITTQNQAFDFLVLLRILVYADDL